jgi:hypothetical protein
MKPNDKKYYDQGPDPGRKFLHNVERPVTLVFRE